MFRWIVATLLSSAIVLSPGQRAWGQGGEKWTQQSSSGKAAADRGNLADAEAYLLNAVKTAEQFDPGDTRLPATLRDLADVYVAQGKYNKAEAPLMRALDIYERFLGADHPDVAESLTRLAEVFLQQGKYCQAEPLLLRALSILETKLPFQDAYIARACCDLATAYASQDKYSEAEPYFQRALTLREKALGPDDPEVGKTLLGYAALLRKTNRASQADKMEARARAILAMP
jgi:tetratricopeptide (TPR) repeat protein